MTTAPFAGCVTDATDFGPPSTSVSFASTSTALAPESSRHGRAVGDRDRASSTAFTTIARVAELRAPSSSVAVNVTVRISVDGASDVLT